MSMRRHLLMAAVMATAFAAPPAPAVTITFERLGTVGANQRFSWSVNHPGLVSSCSQDGNICTVDGFVPGETVTLTAQNPIAYDCPASSVIPPGPDTCPYGIRFAGFEGGFTGRGQFNPSQDACVATFTVPLAYTIIGACWQCGGSANLMESVQCASPIIPVPPPSGTSTTTTLPTGRPPPGISPGDKRDAEDEAFVLFLDALIDCSGLLGSGALSGASPATQPVVNQTMKAEAEADCALDIIGLVFMQTVAQDPPDDDFAHLAVVARASRPSLDLPSCAPLNGADRRFCRHLEAAAGRYVGRVQHVKDVAAALATTANRVSGAVGAGDRRAAKRQLHAFATLHRRFEAARRARAKAGTGLASILRSAHITAQLTAAQAAQAIDVVLGDLAQQGVTDAAARAFLGSALTPQPIDVLSVLARP